MPRKIIPFIVVFALLTISACASKRGKVDDVVFLTNISNNGLKHFEMRPKFYAYQPSIPTANKRNTREVDPKLRHERARKRAIKLAEGISESSGYCQTGFWIIDFDEDARGPYLRGECNDIASEEDREHFVNTLKRW